MRNGFSLIELIVGLAILILVFLAGAYALTPLNQANKKYRLTVMSHKLENEIRRGIYYQNNYLPTGFSISLNGVVIAEEGKIIFVSEDLKSSSELNSGFPFQTKISLVNSASKWGLIYQIKGTLKNEISVVGIKEWPTNVNDFYTNNLNNYTIVEVPPSLAASTRSSCSTGFLRGLKKSSLGTYSSVCWEYKAPIKKPDWSIPTSYTLDPLLNTIEIDYSPLTKINCPAMNVTNNAGVTKSYPGFYALSTIKLNELFPARNLGDSLTSECEKILNLNAYAPNGDIPAAIVLNASINKNPGICPDSTLFKKNSNGSCSLNFNASLIKERVPASVAP